MKRISDLDRFTDKLLADLEFTEPKIIFPLQQEIKKIQFFPRNKQNPQADHSIDTNCIQKLRIKQETTRKAPCMMDYMAKIAEA